MAETPEFIRWTIQRECPLRHNDAWQSPEATQRQLRGIRAYSECVVDGRVLDEICVSHPATDRPADRTSITGFTAAEVFSFFDGQAFVESQCIGCPANVLARQDARHLAGCFGMFEWSGFRAELFAAVDRAIEETGTAARFCEKFTATTPVWYGLWIESPLDDEQTDLLATMFANFPPGIIASDARFTDFVIALNVAREHHLPLHVAYFPCGEATDRHWTVAAHCSRCKAKMRHGDRNCKVCGRSGGPHPERVRHVQGLRPYRLLSDFLADEQVEAFLERYFRGNHHAHS